jgi:hypothetical protein
MYVDILDIHTHMLKGFFGFDLPEANKLPGDSDGTNPSIEQKMVSFHQPVYFFMVDDIPFILEFIPDIFIPIATKLLLKNGFQILQNDRIIHPFTLPGNGLGTGPAARINYSSFIVETTVRDA